jgi:inner membrane protein involved in colicin E2 resistance
MAPVPLTGNPMDSVRFFATSIIAKPLFIGVLILTLLVPLGMIERLIADRGQRRDAASAEVASTWVARRSADRS